MKLPNPYEVPEKRYPSDRPLVLGLRPAVEAGFTKPGYVCTNCRNLTSQARAGCYLFKGETLYNSPASLS